MADQTQFGQGEQNQNQEQDDLANREQDLLQQIKTEGIEGFEDCLLYTSDAADE